MLTMIIVFATLLWACLGVRLWESLVRYPPNGRDYNRLEYFYAAPVLGPFIVFCKGVEK